MPWSPNNRTKVVGVLAKKCKLRIILLPQKSRPKTQVLKEEEIDWLTEFLESGDISYITPGLKDHVCTRIIDGVKQYIQKRYLRQKLRDLFDIFNGQNTVEGNERSFQQKFGYEIFFRRFYEFLRSQNQYIFNKKIP